VRACLYVDGHDPLIRKILMMAEEKNVIEAIYLNK
jgi:hypothetical protein